MENSNSNSMSMKNLALDDQPTYKLKKGCEYVSNSELLSIIINTGIKDYSALSIAQELLKLCNQNLNELGRLSAADLSNVKGISESKALQIVACIELGRRRHSSLPMNKVCIRNSGEIAQYLKTMLMDYSYEVFGVIFLNRANKIKKFSIISRGGICGTVADPRLILKEAIQQEATSIILVHNHPSGSLLASQADISITEKIKHASAFIDVKVLDHIIISSEGYLSFTDEGLL